MSPWVFVPTIGCSDRLYDVIDVAMAEDDAVGRVIVGDNGKIVFSSADIIDTIETTDPTYGGIDDIEAGLGADVAILYGVAAVTPARLAVVVVIAVAEELLWRGVLLDALQQRIGPAWRVAGVDAAAPTLLLSECVLVYLEPEDSCAVIAWAARTFPRSVFVTYEQVRGGVGREARARAAPTLPR